MFMLGLSPGFTEERVDSEREELGSMYSLCPGGRDGATSAVPLGLIFEEGGCVAPAECPCEFHGTLHPPGAVVKEDCNAWCVATAGKWAGWQVQPLQLTSGARNPSIQPWGRWPPPISKRGRPRAGAREGRGRRSCGDPVASGCSALTWKDNLASLGLHFSTCTAGKWVCSTAVCPGMSQLLYRHGA